MNNPVPNTNSPIPNAPGSNTNIPGQPSTGFATEIEKLAQFSPDKNPVLKLKVQRPEVNWPFPTVPAALAQTCFVNPTKLLQAVSDPSRWKVLKALASGNSLTVLDLAGEACRSHNQMSKHLRVLREAGALVIVDSPDGDGRKAHHSVPQKFRRVDESGKPVIDYGVCVLRFP